MQNVEILNYIYKKYEQINSYYDNLLTISNDIIINLKNKNFEIIPDHIEKRDQILLNIQNIFNVIDNLLNELYKSEKTETNNLSELINKYKSEVNNINNIKQTIKDKLNNLIEINHTIEFLIESNSNQTKSEINNLKKMQEIRKKYFNDNASNSNFKIIV